MTLSLGGFDKKLGVDLATWMGNEFEMSMIGQLNFFLGIQINQPPERMSIHQQKYIKDLLTKFNIQDANISDSPIATTTKLDTDEVRISIEETKYRGMVESQLHLTTNRPGIVFSVGICARFQSKPNESHIKVVK